MANIRTAASVSKKLRLFGARAGGVAGIEFGVTGLLLVVGLLNAVDIGFYAYRRMEVENAAEVGAQAAWQTCHDANGSILPATVNCPGLNNAITTAIQSTTLGTAVSLASGYPAEDYRCVNASNVLQSVGSVSSPPANCAAAGNAAASPADYLQVGVTCQYQPLFPGLISVMSVSGVTSISKTSWMRMG
ncbi:MAG: TadE/TadG family type IV pilus assembly protein [Methylocella sp.]